MRTIITYTLLLKLELIWREKVQEHHLEILIYNAENDFKTSLNSMGIHYRKIYI